GGEITAQGTPTQVLRSRSSLTGQYLSGRLSIPVPTNRRLSERAASNNHKAVKGPARSTLDALPQPLQSETGARCPLLIVKGARQHNLKNIDVAFPLGAFIAVTGVSGSGKSSLVHEILFNTLARRLHRARTPGAAHEDIAGLEKIDKVINVDQD